MIIGICGDIGSGKNTVGDLLVEEYGFERASFAEPLKEWVYSLVKPLGVERRYIFGGSPETKQADQREPLEMLSPRLTKTDDGTPGWDGHTYWTGRSLLEYLGTDVGRAIHGDVWVKRFADQYRERDRHRRGFDEKLRIVLTDLRFGNEFDAVHDLNGEVWRTRLDVDHGSNCQIETREDWRQFCNCGAIEATGHASDKEWRFLPYDRLLPAPKPGIDILHELARGYAQEALRGKAQT